MASTLTFLGLTLTSLLQLLRLGAERVGVGGGGGGGGENPKP